MHESSHAKMRELVARYAPEAKMVLDVGSYDVCGTYRDLFAGVTTYTGCDITPGPNVDIVLPSAYEWKLARQFDLVISGQCLEHVEAPWLWIRQVAQACVVGGTVIIIAPSSGWGEHRHPVDCWRIFPDGMRYLLETTAGLSILEVGNSTVGNDTWGVGRKT